MGNKSLTAKEIIDEISYANKKEGEKKYPEEIRKIRFKSGKIEFRYSECNGGFEVVKWYPNSFYGKQDEFEEEEPGRFRKKKYPYPFYVDGKTFTTKENCYVVAFVRVDFDKKTVSLEKVEEDRMDNLSRYIGELNKLQDWLYSVGRHEDEAVVESRIYDFGYLHSSIDEIDGHEEFTKEHVTTRVDKLDGNELLDFCKVTGKGTEKLEKWLKNL